MWIDATIAASFLEVDGVAYAQSPNACLLYTSDAADE